ncbi:hypothetical protein ACP70R_003149 [Stipagrostis hirtigluma subsp. patula]
MVNRVICLEYLHNGSLEKHLFEMNLLDFFGSYVIN